MKREEEQTHDVKARHVNVLKSVNHHRINVVAIERIEFEEWELRIEFAAGEMEQVKDDEREHDQSTDDHMTRSPARLHVLPVDVPLRSRAAIFDREQDRKIDMQNHRGQ